MAVLTISRCTNSTQQFNREIPVSSPEYKSYDGGVRNPVAMLFFFSSSRLADLHRNMKQFLDSLREPQCRADEIQE